MSSKLTKRITRNIRQQRPPQHTTWRVVGGNTQAIMLTLPAIIFAVILTLHLPITVIAADEKPISTETKSVQPPSSSTSSVTPRDEIYIDDDGLEGSGGRGEIHDDLEKEPDYSGSGFGPDDEDSTTSHHSSTTHHQSSALPGSGVGTGSSSSNSGLNGLTGGNNNRNEKDRVTEYDLGSGDGDNDDDDDHDDDEYDDDDDETIAENKNHDDHHDKTHKSPSLIDTIRPNGGDHDDHHGGDSKHFVHEDDEDDSVDIDDDHDNDSDDVYTDVTDPNENNQGSPNINTTTMTTNVDERFGETTNHKDTIESNNEIDLDLDHSNRNNLPTDHTSRTHGGNEVLIMNTKNEDRTASFFAQPGILAAVIGGAVVGLLCAILVVMFIVYRMRKKDEGSYALDEPKRSPAVNSYAKNANNREFYA